MQRLEAKLAGDYRVRIGMLVGLLALIALPMLRMATRSGHWSLWLIALLPGAIAAPMLLRSYRRSPRLFDADGVLLRSGRRHRWDDYIEQRDVTFSTKFGGSGLSHVEVRFRDGVVPIFPSMFSNLHEIYLFLRRVDAAAQAPAADAAVSKATLPAPTASAPVPPPAPAGPCALCAELGDYSHAMQTHGREHEDTFLPAAAGKMVRLKEVRPGANRTPVLERCPGCGDFFLYKIVYDFLTTGSEDEQIMERLTATEAQRYLDGWDGRS